MYYYPHDLRQHYSATPSGYSSSMSSGVSTPAMTPPFAPVMDTMLSHGPSWMTTAPGENNPLLLQVQNLQAQTAQLALMIKEHAPVTQRYHVPMYMTPPSPAPPVAGNYSDAALHAAQSVLNSVPANQQLEESVLAKAVVAAANALLLAGAGPGARTGHISALRIPTAVRPLDPDTSLVFANYKRNSSSESPAPSDRGSKCNSPLLRDGVPMFGLEPKSPGTVTKCARQDE